MIAVTVSEKQTLKKHYSGQIRPLCNEKCFSSLRIHKNSKCKCNSLKLYKTKFTELQGELNKDIIIVGDFNTLLNHG